MSFYGEDDRPNLLHGCDGHVGSKMPCPLYGNGCWAEGMAKRQGGGRAGYPEDDPFRPACPPNCGEAVMELLIRLRHVRRPRTMAFCFMGDISCHEAKNVRAMADMCDLPDAQRHTFLWLTKNPVLLREKLGGVPLPPNVWLGASVMNQAMADALIPDLLAIPAAHHWLSIEPMWGPIDLKQSGGLYARGGGVFPIGLPREQPALPANWHIPALSWLVCGCESGPKRRLFCPDSPHNPMSVRTHGLTASGLAKCEASFLDAVRSLRDQCKAAGVALFVKQLPLDGEVMNNIEGFPVDLAIQERPWRITEKEN